MGTERQYELGSKTFRPESLSALVLADLEASVEAYFGRPVAEAVATVPAYFGETQRRATQVTCELAGLFVERIINEPTAAALAYGYPVEDGEARLAVFDLGGGTFDISILDLVDGVVEILASAGDARLGGEDFVEAMMVHCAALIGRHERGAVDESTATVARLRDACERAKRALSDVETTTLVLPHANVGGSARTVELELARAQVHG